MEDGGKENIESLMMSERGEFVFCGRSLVFFVLVCVRGNIVIEMCHTIPTILVVSIFYPNETNDSYVDVFMSNDALTYTIHTRI